VLDQIGNIFLKQILTPVLKTGGDKVYPELGTATTTIVNAIVQRSKTHPDEIVQWAEKYTQLPALLRCLLENGDRATIQAIRDELNREQPHLGDLFENAIRAGKQRVKKKVTPKLPQAHQSVFASILTEPPNYMQFLTKPVKMLTNRPLESPPPPPNRILEGMLRGADQIYRKIPSFVRKKIEELELTTLNKSASFINEKSPDLGTSVKTLVFFLKDKLNS
jgi:hypothetical protein